MPGAKRYTGIAVAGGARQGRCAEKLPFITRVYLHTYTHVARVLARIGGAGGQSSSSAVPTTRTQRVNARDERGRSRRGIFTKNFFEA
jgi:hypothetical protein